MKIQVTALQRANAIEARDGLWPTVPPENVSGGLRHWRDEPDMEWDTPHCGTIACFGGWCQHWPPFAEQVNARIWNVDTASYTLFGLNTMFSVRGCVHPMDDAPQSATDHELVTYRLNWLIENSEIV